MATEPRLSFSANGSGVILHTRYGELNFGAGEYEFYLSLFKIADTASIGKLIVGSSQLTTLLVRTEVPWDHTQKAIEVVGTDDELEQPGLNVNQWLTVCKLLACYQALKKVPSEKVFKQLHKTVQRIPLVEFNLSKSIPVFGVGEYYKVYSSEIVSWQNYGEEYEGHHVKFKLSTTSQLVNNCDMITTSKDERFVVERRYSDFESFSSILHRNYKGIIIPPLPPKNWAFPLTTTPADSSLMLNQRMRELQLFLDDVVSHPVLRHSFELKAFLESSSAGFKCFVELYSHINDGRVIYTDSSSNNSSGVTKFLSEGVQAMSGAGQAVAQTKAFGYLTTLWGAVSKSVFNRNGHTHSDSPEEVLLFRHTSQFLDMAVTVGQKLEHLVALQAANSAELSKLSQCFKNMSEFEPVPDLVRAFQLAHEGLVDLTRTQSSHFEKLTLAAQVPVVYAGRYSQSYQSATAQRTSAMAALEAAQRREADSKKAADMLVASASSAPPPSASSSPSSTTYNEELLNHAKLDLAAAEDAYEAAREAEAVVTTHLKTECRRLQTAQGRRVLNHLVSLAKVSAEGCHANVIHWQALRDMMDSLRTGSTIGSSSNSSSGTSSTSSSGGGAQKISAALLSEDMLVAELLPVSTLLDISVSDSTVVEAPAEVAVAVKSKSGGKKKKGGASNNKS